MFLLHYRRLTTGSGCRMIGGMATIACPSCQAFLQLPDSILGRRVRCPGCKKVFVAEAEQQVQEVTPPEPKRSEPIRRRRREEIDDDDYPELDRCPDCNRRVSPRAYECPSCGAPLRRPHRSVPGQVLKL